jgi:ABC-2 type transport system permease protein
MRAELRKLVTARSTWLLLAIAQLIVVAGVSGLMIQQDDPASDDGQRGAIAHVGLVALFGLLIGILAVAGEYRHRTITDTFLARPRRERVMLSKLVVSAGAGAVFGVVASATALIADAIWLAAKGSSIDLAGGVLWRTVAGGIGWNIAFAAIGVGVGALITNLSAAVAAALAWLALIEGIVGELIGDASRWLPFALGQALVGLPNSADRPAVWQAGLVLVLYAAIFVAAGISVTTRRDVTH